MKKYIQLLLGFLLCIGAGIQAAEPVKKSTFDPLRRATGLAEKIEAKRKFDNLPDVEKTAIKMECRDALEDLKDPGNNPHRLLKEVRKELKEDSRNHFKEQIDIVKWQNTLQYSVETPLTFTRAEMAEALGGEDTLKELEQQTGKIPSLGIRLGLYNKDLAAFGLGAADVAGDVLVYRSLTRRRIETIFASMKDDYNGILRAFELSLTAEEDYEGKQGDQPLDEYYIKTIACAPLRKYIAEKHVLIGSFPINKKILVPLIARYAWEKVSAAAKESFFPDISQGCPEDSMSFVPKRKVALFGAQKLAYTKVTEIQGDGTQEIKLKPYLGVPPISASTCASWVWNIFNPSITGFGRMMRSILDDPLKGSSDYLPSLNKFLGFGIPQVFFSDTAYTIYDFLGIGFSMKCFDDHMSVNWIEYVISNRKAITIALREYQAAVDNPNIPIETLNKAEAKLLKFIEEGHKSGFSWFPMSIVERWRNFRQIGGSKISLMTGAFISAVSAVKVAFAGKSIYNWYYS